MLAGARASLSACAYAIAVGPWAFGFVIGARTPLRCPLLFAYFLLCCVTLVGAAPAIGTGEGAYEDVSQLGMEPGAAALHALNTRLLVSASAQAFSIIYGPKFRNLS